MIYAAAIRIHAGLKSGRSGLLGCLHIVVACIYVFDGGAITCHVTLQSVGAAGYGVQIESAGGGWHPVHRIIGGHHRWKIVIFNEFLVRIEVEFPHIPAIHVGTAHVAVELTVVCEIVLRAWDGLHIIRIVAHKSADIGTGHHSRKERILPVGLSGSSPPWVTDRFHYRRPEGKALGSGLEDCTGLVCDGRSHPFKKLGIPGRTDCHTVRIRGRALLPHFRVCTRKDSVQSLAPYIVLSYSQPRHRSHIVAKQTLLLLKGESGHQIHSPFFKAVICVLIDRQIILGSCCSAHKKE